MRLHVLDTGYRCFARTGFGPGLSEANVEARIRTVRLRLQGYTIRAIAEREGVTLRMISKRLAHARRVPEIDRALPLQVKGRVKRGNRSKIKGMTEVETGPTAAL